MTEIRVEGSPNLFGGTHDARPSEELLVFRRHPESGEIVEARLRWGLIPHWARTRPDVIPINARAESIAEKPTFRDAYRLRRCIVPMDSFYERDHRRKLHAFSLIDGAPFQVAGIWENWRNAQTEKWERTFAVITVEANTLVAQVHDRMPAILHTGEHVRWLSDEADPRDLLRPFPAELMIGHPVSRRRK